MRNMNLSPRLTAEEDSDAEFEFDRTFDCTDFSATNRTDFSAKPTPKERTMAQQAALQRMAELLAKRYPIFTAYEILHYQEEFARFDEDGSGDIDTRKICKLFNSLGEPISKKAAAAVIAQFYKGGEGTMDFEEFVDMIYQLKTGTVKADDGFLRAYGDDEKDGNVLHMPCVQCDLTKLICKGVAHGEAESFSLSATTNSTTPGRRGHLRRANVLERDNQEVEDESPPRFLRQSNMEKENLSEGSFSRLLRQNAIKRQFRTPLLSAPASRYSGPEQTENADITSPTVALRRAPTDAATAIAIATTAPGTRTPRPLH